MKSKFLLAFFLLFVALNAHSQSSVILYGILDNGITYTNNMGGKSSIQENTGIMQGNRWGLLGTEDLGGGLKAIFTLENGFTLNNGALAQGGLLFGRQAFVGLSSNTFGTMTLGRQYDFMCDFLVQDSAGNEITTAAGFHFQDVDRVACEELNNSVKYVTSSFYGVTAGAMYAFSNQAGAFGGNSANPRGMSFGAKYDNGPLSIGAAYTDVDGQTGSLATIAFGGTSLRTMGLGARYRFDKTLVFGNITTTSISNTAAGGTATVNNYEIGAAYQLTPAFRYGGGYTLSTWNGYQYHQFNFALDYFLSKRTDLYLGVNYQHTNNDATGAGIWLVATPGSFKNFSTSNNQVAVRLGIRHNF